MNILLAAAAPLVALSLLFVLTVVTFAVLAPGSAPDPSEQYIEGLSLEGAPLPPDSTWLGTDLLGRDLFSRLVCTRAPRSSSAWLPTAWRC